MTAYTSSEAPPSECATARSRYGSGTPPLCSSRYALLLRRRISLQQTQRPVRALPSRPRKQQDMQDDDTNTSLMCQARHPSGGMSRHARLAEASQAPVPMMKCTTSTNSSASALTQERPDGAATAERVDGMRACLFLAAVRLEGSSPWRSTPLEEDTSGVSTLSPCSSCCASFALALSMVRSWPISMTSLRRFRPASFLKGDGSGAPVS